MYSSIFVGILSKIWNFIRKNYEYSILKRILNFIGRGIKALFKGSVFAGIFISNRKLIEESLLYKIYRIFIKGINKFIEFIKKIVTKDKKGSIISNCCSVLFKDDVSIINTFSFFFISFGIFIIINDMVRGKFTGKSYIVSFILIIFSLMSLKLEKNYKERLENSFMFNFVKNLFLIDEERGEKWW